MSEVESMPVDASAPVQEVAQASIPPDTIVRLVSQDDKAFEVEYQTICLSVLVRNLLEDVGVDDDEPIPLPNVHSETLERVLEWCKHHKDDIEPFFDDFEDEFETTRHVTLTEWDRSYFDIDHEIIFDILMAANYLDIKLLLDQGCKTVANMLKGKTVEQIREMFNIENDFTPEEEEAIRRENEWAEDR